MRQIDCSKQNEWNIEWMSDEKLKKSLTLIFPLSESPVFTAQ